MKDNFSMHNWRIKQELKENDLDEESVRMFKSDNPEGDKLVLAFLKHITKEFDIPMKDAVLFVRERLNKLGY